MIIECVKTTIQSMMKKDIIKTTIRILKNYWLIQSKITINKHWRIAKINKLKTCFFERKIIFEIYREKKWHVFKFNNRWNWSSFIINFNLTMIFIENLIAHYCIYDRVHFINNKNQIDFSVVEIITFFE